MKSSFQIANSIGAFFSINANLNDLIEKAYFISPLVNMEKLICDMMQWANVTEAELEQRKIIPTDFGEKDNLTSIDTMRIFAEKQGASLTVMKGGEHWFHTEDDIYDFLAKKVELALFSAIILKPC